MKKKTRWVYNDDKKHFFKTNPAGNKWGEYSNKMLVATFEFLTYDGGNIILYNKDSRKYIQLGDSQVRIASSLLENLDTSSEVYDGFWIRSDRIDNTPEQASLWIEQNLYHFFENVNKSKTWSEYKNDEKVVEYVLYKQRLSDFILQNKKNPNIYLVLTKTGYAIGELDFVSKTTQMNLGFWIVEPEFSNCKT